MPTTRDIPFDEHTPEAPAHVRENFADLRPLAEVEAMRRKWADNLDRARERFQAEHGKQRKVVQ
jgi:hypothetical protein